MNVETLENVLKDLTQQPDVKPIMRKIAHWTKTIKNNGTYLTVDQKEIESIEKLRDLGIFDISSDRGVVRIALSESGKQLSDDFYRKAFYI